MGREVRKVPVSWEHPRNDKGKYIPMHEHFPYNEEEIKEGLRDGWLKDEPPNYGCDVMPQWPVAERTHYQMYEDTTEGTPVSPVMDTPEKLARWLADNGASAFASQTASYEAWLSMIKRGSVPSAMIVPGKGVISGVEGMEDR
jgi:hypothetical protein